MRCWHYARDKATEIGVQLPELPDGADPAAAYADQEATGRWVAVTERDLRPGDVVAMRLPRAALHVGVVVFAASRPSESLVAHLTDDGERRDRLRSLRPFLRGIWRWRG